MQKLIDDGSSVLNRGLGAFGIPTKRKRMQDRQIWTPWVLVPLSVGALLTIPSILVVEFSFLRNSGESSIFSEDDGFFVYGMTSLASIPLACAGVNFIVEHIRRTTFFWEKEKDRGALSKARYIDPLSCWPMLLTALTISQGACLKILIPSLAIKAANGIEGVIVLICLHAYYTVLDIINESIAHMAHDQEDLNALGPVKKMQGLVRNITRTGKPEKDMVYAFESTNTVPAKVLSYVWWLYYIFGKVFGATVTLAYFLDVDKNTLVKFLASALFVTAATITGALFELGPNTMSLLRLALNKPFYVGDLVTLNKTGAMDDPMQSIMGFVENITMKYVVIRNFQMKQTWIPHGSFSQMIIQNWTRRPSKTVLLNIGISCRCPVQKVQKLTSFGMRWIEKSPEIQQTNYRKCHITKIANGYNIEVIFFPEIGVTHRGIRQKWLVAFMAAAERLQIPFVPLQMAWNYCDENNTAPLPPEPNSTEAEDNVEHIVLDDLLPDPNDRLPKGVGLGFKQFPQDRSGEEAAAATGDPQLISLGVEVV